MTPLTKIQAETLDYIREFFEDNDQLPPRHIIAKHFGIAENAANFRLSGLAKKGYLKSNAVGKYMFTRGEI